MFGYCEIGKRAKAIIPIKIIKRAITPEKRGRLIKKSENVILFAPCQ